MSPLFFSHWRIWCNQLRHWLHKASVKVNIILHGGLKHWHLAVLYTCRRNLVLMEYWEKSQHLGTFRKGRKTAGCPGQGGGLGTFGTGRGKASSSERGELPQMLLILVLPRAAHPEFSVGDSPDFILLNRCCFLCLKKVNKYFPPENIFLVSRHS